MCQSYRSELKKEKTMLCCDMLDFIFKCAMYNSSIEIMNCGTQLKICKRELQCFT